MILHEPALPWLILVQKLAFSRLILFQVSNLALMILHDPALRGIILFVFQKLVIPRLNLHDPALRRLILFAFQKLSPSRPILLQVTNLF